tara:strand:- start:8037 stop:8300 length:264 start_codon:yes stop_codon:yes gene_type:complete
MSNATRTATDKLVRHLQCLVVQTLTIGGVARCDGWEWADGGVAFDLTLGLLNDAIATGEVQRAGGFAVYPCGEVHRYFVLLKSKNAA